jgi:hypothetical protein
VRRSLLLWGVKLSVLPYECEIILTTVARRLTKSEAPAFSSNCSRQACCIATEASAVCLQLFSGSNYRKNNYRLRRRSKLWSSYGVMKMSCEDQTASVTATVKELWVSVRHFCKFYIPMHARKGRAYYVYRYNRFNNFMWSNFQRAFGFLPDGLSKSLNDVELETCRKVNSELVIYFLIQSGSDRQLIDTETDSLLSTESFWTLSDWAPQQFAAKVDCCT